MSITTLFQTSSQSKVYTQNYGVPKSRELQFWEFQDSHLGVLGQNAIWMWASCRGTEYTIRGEGGGFPQLWAMVSLVNLNLLVVCFSTKSAPTMH